MTEVTEPKNIVVLRHHPKYTFLKKGMCCTVPIQYADELIKQDFAEVALQGLDFPQAAFGLNHFEPKTKKKGKTEDHKDEDIVKTSLFIDDAAMYEQIKAGALCSFLRYDFLSGNITTHDYVDGEVPLYPIVDEEVVAGHIQLPSGIAEYGTEEELISEIEAHVRKYLDVPQEYLHYAALNVLKSWVYERYNSLNYLRVQGEPGTGKSRFLDVIGGLHYKPIATSGATTVAPVFRLINKWGCTLIMDEADMQKSDETNEMIKIINQGFEKGKPVLRCNPDDKSKVEFFNVYCPKVLSTRHVFDDIATESRCMTQIMTGTTRNDIIASLNDAFRAEQQDLRNKLLLWRFRNYKRINPDIGEKLDWSGIEPRLKQVNIGFVSLIYNDKPYIEKFMQRIRDKQAELRNERSETTEGHIIAACARIVLEDKPLIAKTIINYADLTDQKGQKWKPRKIASYMKTLGFLGTKLERVKDYDSNGNEITVPEKVYQYNAEVFAQLFQKYLTVDEFEDFKKQAELKVSDLKFCNYVTVVTIVSGRGKNGYAQNFQAKNAESAHSVTNTPPHHKEGYNGYTVTNKVEKLLSDGDLVEIKPGVYKQVTQ